MSEIDNNVSETEQMPAPVKPVRKRRPRKTANQTADQNTSEAEKTVKRTRRKKTDETQGDAEAVQTAPPVKRVRRKKTEAASDSAEQPVKRTRRKKTAEQGETVPADAESAEQPVKRTRRRKTAETETDTVRKPAVKRVRRKKPEPEAETAEQTLPAEPEKQNETETPEAVKEPVLAFGMPEAVSAEESLREIPEEHTELPSRYETPEYQAFLKEQFPEEVSADQTDVRALSDEAAEQLPVPEIPAEEQTETEITAAEPEVIPFTAEEVSAEDNAERSIVEETPEEIISAEETQPEAESPAEEPVPEEPEVIPFTAEEILAEDIAERSIAEETPEENISTEETQPEVESPVEEPDVSEKELSEENRTEEELTPEYTAEESAEQMVSEEAVSEQPAAEESETSEEAERSVSEESSELPSRYETPEYQAFLKEQQEAGERTLPAENAGDSETETEQKEAENEELPSRYDTPEYQAFLKEQEKEEIPFTEEAAPAEENGERSVPEGNEEKDPGPRRKRIAEQNRRKKKKSKKKEKYVSKVERGIVEEKPIPVRKPETEIPEEVQEEPEIVTPADQKNTEPEVIPFVNPRDQEQQAEVIPFLSELTPEEPGEDDKERTRSISLSSIEAEASEPIPEPSVSFEELKYKRNPLIKRISDPNGSMANVTEMTPRSGLSILWGLLLKWGLSCVVYVAYAANILNKDAFSYARMVFTDASWFWFRIVVICIAAELLAMIMAKLICRGSRKAGMGKIMTVLLEANFSPLLFMAGGALLFVNTAAGAAVTAVAAGYELLMRIKALEIATECKKAPAIIASLLFFCVLAALGYAGLKYFGGDLIKIYSVISGK